MEVCVDASCSQNPGAFEYRGVEKGTKKELFSFQFPYGSNNIGEFLAIVHAMGYLKKLGITKATIYSDSVTALAWVRNAKCNSKILPHQDEEINNKLKNIISRAELFLKNRPPYEVLKWDTRTLGEIDADYGRK